MKKLLLIVLGIGFFVSGTVAQTKPDVPELPVTPAAPVKVEMTKEEKAAMKAKQDSEYLAAYKGAGLTEEEIVSVKTIMAEASKKNSELKKNTNLNDVERETAKKLISDEKNNKLKELMGKERYKLYTDIRKKQKEAATIKPE